MPVTRRKRANPPDQPENNTNHLADQPENNPEGLATELPAASPAVSKETEQATDASAASAPPTAPTRQDTTPSALTLPSGQTFMPPPALSPSTNGERGDRGLPRLAEAPFWSTRRRHDGNRDQLAAGGGRAQRDADPGDAQRSGMAGQHANQESENAIRGRPIRDGGQQCRLGTPKCAQRAGPGGP